MLVVVLLTFKGFVLLLATIFVQIFLLVSNTSVVAALSMEFCVCVCACVRACVCVPSCVRVCAFNG